jgi:hypothetical protein
MKLLKGTALFALGTLAAVPALASDKQDFATCDGRVHPGRQDDGMRGPASESGGFSGFGFNTRMPAVTVGACTRALASPRLLPTQTLRKAHLLRARAAAQLELGKYEEALADLDLAATAVGPQAQDRFYRRSMGVSLDLLRALALVQAGDVASAVPLAQAASAARPYSLDVQRVAATVIQASRPLGAPSPSPWLGTVRLAPETGSMALAREAEIGNFAGVLKMRPDIPVDWPSAPAVVTEKKYTILSVDGAVLSGVQVSLDTAYARAATGDPQGARRELEEMRVHLAAARPPAPAPDAGRFTITGSVTWEMVDRYVARRTRQIDARIAVAEGRTSDAVSALLGAGLPNDAATIELLGALKAANKEGTLSPDTAGFTQELAADRKKTVINMVDNALLAPETPRAVVDYEKARPNILGALVGGALSMGTSLLGGIGRTDGFRTKQNADGTTTVEFLGNTPSAALVQEMTLLRAAEVTRAANKPAFRIVKRSDYVRRLTTTQYGVQTSSTPRGYKTELTIRFLDAGETPGQAFDALAIIDALGPLYYEETPQTATRAR